MRIDNITRLQKIEFNRYQDRFVEFKLNEKDYWMPTGLTFAVERGTLDQDVRMAHKRITEKPKRKVSWEDLNAELEQQIFEQTGE